MKAVILAEGAWNKNEETQIRSKPIIEISGNPL